MDKRIELEMRGKPASEITTLNLDNCRATQVTGLTEEFTNLEVLSLINVGLTSLKGFPKLPKLRKLELSDNRLSVGLENLFGCESLATLNLSGNKIKEISELEPLKNLPKLRALDLFNCDVTNSDDYRTRMFEVLPNLKYLDGFDREDKEQDSDDGDGLDVEGDDEDEEDEDYSENDDDDDNDEEDEDEEEDEDDEEEDNLEEDDDEPQIINGEHKEDDKDASRGKKRKHEGDDDE